MPDTPPSLALFLLGPPRIEVKGQPVTIRRRKALALLAYLALHRDGRRRDSLAALFWPESSQNEARTALSRHLSELKTLLGDPWLLLDQETVCLVQTADFWLDINQVQHLLAERLAPTTDTLLRLTAGVTLYHDDFLTGFSLLDCPDFDNWQYLQAETLRQTLAAALEKLAQLCLAQGAYEQGIGHAQRWLALDSLHESAHCQLMMLYAQQGESAAALRQYERCQQLLRAELGITPSPETSALYERIRKGELARQTPSKPKTNDSSSKAVPVVAVTPPAFLQTLDQKHHDPKSRIFVARSQELTHLQVALTNATRGQSQPLFVIGGPGRGKTTLLDEFAQRAMTADPNLLVIIGHCDAYTGSSDPYLPFRSALNLLLGNVEAKLTSGHITPLQAQRLWEAMPFTLPLFADHALDLLNTFVPAQGLLSRAATFAQNDPAWLLRLAQAQANASGATLAQNRLFEQYTALLHAVAAQRPLLLILEDLHWADASSISLLVHLCRQIATQRILIVGTYRPSEVAQGRDNQPHPLTPVIADLKRQYGEIALNLSESDAMHGRHFVDEYLATQPHRLDVGFRQALFVHTGGHPLFTVEIFQALQESGDLQQDAHGQWTAARTIAWDRLPAKVEGVIEQRIAALADELRQTLLVASVEGETFTAEVTARVQSVEALTLVRRLSHEIDKKYQLVAAQGLARVGQQRLSHYRFRHQLFQKYLYNSLDAAERSYLHENVGTILEAFYGEQTGEIAVQLAWHFQEADLPVKAISYLQTAAQRAIRSSAYVEAARHYSLALHLLATLPATPERDSQELMLQVSLGQVLIVAKGFGHIEVAHAFNRARELYEQIGDFSQRIPILMGLASYYHVRAQHEIALNLGKQLLELTQRQPNTAYLLMAHIVMGLNLLFLGKLMSARSHLEQMVALYVTEQHHTIGVSLSGGDSGSFGLGSLGFTLWYLGYPDQALKCQDKAMILARSLAHPYSLAFALGILMPVHHLRGEMKDARARAEENIALSSQKEMPLWIAPSMCIVGLAMAAEGEIEGGVAQLKQGLDLMGTIGTISLQLYYQIFMSEVLVKAGQIEEGMALVNQALSPENKTDQHLYDAELYRLKGDLLQRQGVAADEVEACYRQGIVIARSQAAKSLELRATMSLCRLLQQQGRNAEGQQMLAELYAWFTEGFATADLIEAKALLAELDRTTGG